MSNAQTTEPTVETIGDASIWKTICDGVNTLAHGEAVFVFTPDEVDVRVKDAANVVLIGQRVPAESFDHYDVEREWETGINTEKFANLLDVADEDQPVHFAWDWENFVLRFKAGEVEYKMAGKEPDTFGDKSPVEIPPLKDSLPYCVDVTLPTASWRKGSDVVELATGDYGEPHGSFKYDAESGDFYFEASGDNDTSRVVISDHDDFEWRDPEPDDAVTCKQSNEYMAEVVGLIEEDTVRFVCGPETPYHVWTDRDDGRVETKIVQAPRVSNP